MSRAVADLLSILDLEQLERNLFRGRSPQTSWQRVFGGQVIGQALVAACRTVEKKTSWLRFSVLEQKGDVRFAQSPQKNASGPVP